MKHCQNLLIAAICLVGTLGSLSCSPSDGSPSALSKTMQLEDVAAVLGDSVDLPERLVHSGSSNRFLVNMSADEYSGFVDRFTSELESVGRDSFSYQAISVSATKHDDNLSYFSISLGKKNTHDITISGTYDGGTQRLLIRIYTTKA